MVTGRELVISAHDRINVRTSLRAMPEDVRPDLRRRTVTPAWAHVGACRAIAGDRAGFRAGGSAYQPPADGSVLLVANETAVPAPAALLEVETRPVRVFAEAPEESYRVDREP
ncbi:hypothetical protein UK23_35530 [Lentzea aerocolonigenes]|uniref:Uncharacterized protein n=2 Tax=Lentzea aerocolonigenes TaxID=68170 RepID=A0A0F0GN26_LENAE|nr:hypothetical protein UK23_35530 [Lentzea aerocolonigenes]